jgi:hypothetical protein
VFEATGMIEYLEARFADTERLIPADRSLKTCDGNCAAVLNGPFEFVMLEG